MIRISIWLTKKKNREEKQYFFVRLIFNFEKKSINAVKNELIIAEAICKCSKYVNIKLTDQCNKCQQYDHMSTKCSNAIKCRLCVKNHDTKDHKCHICTSKDTCSHSKLKCVNCSQKHRANDNICEVFQTLRFIRNSMIDELWVIKTQILSLETSNISKMYQVAFE